jgi:HK97 gp10 family phage protein
MSDGGEIKLQGDRDIVAAFRELRQFLPRNALRKAVREGANILLGAILQRVRVRTGKLKNNIGIKVRVTRETIRSRVTVNTRGKEGDPKNAFYYRFLEKGFTTRSGEKKIFPFVGPAVMSKMREAAQKVIDALGNAITRAEQKARKSGFIRRLL